MKNKTGFCGWWIFKSFAYVQISSSLFYHFANTRDSLFFYFRNQYIFLFTILFDCSSQLCWNPQSELKKKNTIKMHTRLFCHTFIAAAAFVHLFFCSIPCSIRLCTQLILHIKHSKSWIKEISNIFKIVFVFIIIVIVYYWISHITYVFF